MLQNKVITQGHFNRVATLVEGFESAYGLELLATVYGVIAKEGASSLVTIREKVNAWAERKKKFNDD